MAAMKLGGFSAVSLLYVLAFILAIGGALVPTMLPSAMVTPVAVILGIVAGLVAISMKERMPVLIASLAVALIGGVFGMLPYVGTYLTNFFIYLASFASPIALITALLVIWDSRK